MDPQVPELSNYTPAQAEPQADALIQVSEAPFARNEECIIKYDPVGKRRIWRTLVSWWLLFGCVQNITSSETVYFLLFAYFFLNVDLYYRKLCFPNALCLNSSGISLMWRSWFGTRSTSIIPWECVNKVNVLNDRFLTSALWTNPRAKLAFHVNPPDSIKNDQTFRSMFPSIWRKEFDGRYILRLSVEGLRKGDSLLEILGSCISHNIEKDKIEAQVCEGLGIKYDGTHDTQRIAASNEAVVTIECQPWRAFLLRWQSVLQRDFKSQANALAITALAAVASFCVFNVIFRVVIHPSFSSMLPYLLGQPLFYSPLLAWLVFYFFIGSCLITGRVRPTQIKCAGQGLSLKWYGCINSPLIPWSNISYVQLAERNSFLARIRWLDFRVFVKNISPKDYLVFSAFFPGFWGNGDTAILSIDVGGVDYDNQMQRLNSALHRHLTPEHLQPRLIETFAPIQDTSYTALWLDALSSSPERVRSEPLSIGMRVGDDRYTVLEQIGAGGQGIAYLASVETALPEGSPPARLVVLKEFILPSHGGVKAQCRTLDNIQREADLLKRIAHPQIVSLLDFFIEDHRAYLVLEHIKGDSLRNLVQSKGALKEDRIIELAVQLCNILEHLHGQSPPVIHRDFTPENIILGHDGIARLIDFNVAQQRESTSTRTVVGKHSYIPPEQFRGKATTQSDIYALGGTLFFMCAGDDPEPITVSHPQTVRAEISQRLDAIVAHATAISTDARYKTAHEIKEDLLR